MSLLQLNQNLNFDESPSSKRLPRDHLQDARLGILALAIAAEHVMVGGHRVAERLIHVGPGAVVLDFQHVHVEPAAVGKQPGRAKALEEMVGARVAGQEERLIAVLDEERQRRDVGRRDAAGTAQLRGGASQVRAKSSEVVVPEKILVFRGVLANLLQIVGVAIEPRPSTLCGA